MALPEINITNVSQAIQLALTPVFLLTGIGGLLNVMTGRLARIIDRGRYLAETPPPTLAGSARLERRVSYCFAPACAHDPV